MSPRRDAALMLVGIGITDLTFRLSQVAVPLVVLAATGSAAATGVSAGAAGVPVVLSPWWTRRLRQRITSGRAVAGCYLGEAASLALVAGAASLGRLSIPLLLVAGLLLGCAEALSGPGRDALVADLGDRIGEDRALTLLTTRDFFRRVSMIVGPAAGGLAVAHGWGVEVLWVEVVSILLSASLAAMVRGAASASECAGVEAGIWATVRELPEVLAGWVIRSAGCALWFGFTLGLALLGADEGRGGTFLAAGMSACGVGSVLGTVFVIRLLRILPVLPAIAGAWATAGLGWLAMGTWPVVPVIEVAGFVSGIAIAIGNAGVTAQITRESTGSTRRTLLAGQSVVVNAASSAGLLVGGSLIGLLGPSTTLVATGSVTALVPVVVLVAFRDSPALFGR